MKCIDKKCEYRGLNGGDEVSDFYFCTECGVSVDRGQNECLFDKWNTNIKKINILGSEWTIKKLSEEEDKLLKDCDGYCDWTTKEIVVEKEEYGTLKDIQKYINKVLRHEITHAFLFESGLAECSGEVDSWAMNETMVDWIARQGQKIYKAWQDADCLD